MSEAQRCDVLVLGGGAAGLFCAIEIARRGARTIVVERGDAVGKKILISGGGRCNFTNLASGPEHFLSENPHFCRSALARYRPADFVALVESHHIAYHEKAQGQLFCDGSARQIVAMLVGDARAAGARIEVGCEIGAVDRTDRFRVRTSRGAFEAPALVVATGGLSVPSLGATGVGYRIAERFGLPIVPTRPGLVPSSTAPPTARASPGSAAWRRPRWCAAATRASTTACCSRTSACRDRRCCRRRRTIGPATWWTSTSVREGTSSRS